MQVIKEIENIGDMATAILDGYLYLEVFLPHGFRQSEIGRHASLCDVEIMFNKIGNKYYRIEPA